VRVGKEHQHGQETENFKAGNVKVTCCNSGSNYLGIRNPDATYGINVLVEVVALV
jgi:hypothetical protein